MSMTPNSGVGMKPTSGPQGLRIATSPFTSQPMEEVAAADVYDITNPGVINSFQDEADESFFDKIKNGISGAIGSLNLGSLGDMASGSKGILDSVRKGTSLVRNITNVASRAMSAANQIKNGGIMGTVGGLASIAGMSGMGGAGALAGQARGIINGINQGGIGGIMRAGGALMGSQGNALNQLAGNLNTIDRLAQRGFSAAGGIGGILSTVDNTVGIASATLSSLDRTSQIDFSKGFDAVMGHSNISGKSLSQSTLGKVYTAVSDLTTAATEKITMSHAGVAAGLVTLGSNNGDNSIFSSLVSKGLDSKSAFSAGVAVSALAARSGNIGVLADISSTDIGRQALGSNPYALVATVANLTPDVNTYNRPLHETYDSIETVSKNTSQSWRTTERAEGGGAVAITDVSCMRTSNYMAEVIIAKSASDHFNSERLTESTALKANVTDAQVMHAATSAFDYEPASYEPKWGYRMDDEDPSSKW